MPEGKKHGEIDFKAIYNRNKHGWYDMTEDSQKYEALLAGHHSDRNHLIWIRRAPNEFFTRF